MTEIDWRATNLANWESRVAVHTGPGGYDLAAFADPAHLSDVVRYDLPRLGDLTGLDVVHLQCHLGTDTLSLARLGARCVTGLDFSPSALAAARALSGDAVTYFEADVYAAVDALGAERFDLVYTGIGALCWLPDITAWAQAVAALLRPGGRLFLREGHPMLWALDDPRPDGLFVVTYPYFATEGTVFTEDQSYSGEGLIASPEAVNFNHGLASVFTALTAAGLTVTAFEEHREVPWNPLGELMQPSPVHPGEWVLAQDPARLPLTYTMQATKTPC